MDDDGAWASRPTSLKRDVLVYGLLQVLKDRPNIYCFPVDPGVFGPNAEGRRSGIEHLHASHDEPPGHLTNHLVAL